MKMKIRLILTILAGSLLYHAPAFCENGGTVTVGNSDVVAAINALQNAVITSLSNSITPRIQAIEATTTNLFNETFIDTNSTIDKKLGVFMKNFYEIYTRTFSPNTITLPTNAETGIQDMLKNDVNYNINTNLKDKTPYGSLGPSNTNDTPNFAALIGTDAYDDPSAADSAKSFLRQVLLTSPPPKMFHIPPKGTGDSITIYTPTSSVSAAGEPRSYTEVTVTKNEYDKMANYLKGTPLYSEYEAKTKSMLTLRTLFLDTVFRSYQERLKNKNSKSLVAEEKEMATEGLNKNYYTKLQTSSIADVNLETLHTLNKIVYLLYKLHQDNERSLLVLSMSAMQLQSQSLGDEQRYVKPISTIIENKCWAPTDSNKTTCNQAVGKF